jgi:hypothetical protein
MRCPLSQLVSAAAEALANDVHELLLPSLHVPGRAAASAAHASVTPQKSRQQQRVLQPPPRVLPQEESTASAGGGAVAVAFKRRTVVTHSGGVVTSTAGDVSTAAAVASVHEYGAGIESNSNDLLDDAMVASTCPSGCSRSLHSPLYLLVSQATAAAQLLRHPACRSLSTSQHLSRYRRAWNCAAMLLTPSI